MCPVSAQASNRGSGTGFMSNFSTLTKKFNTGSRSTAAARSGMKSSTDSINSAFTDTAGKLTTGVTRDRCV